MTDGKIEERDSQIDRWRYRNDGQRGRIEIGRQATQIDIQEGLQDRKIDIHIQEGRTYRNRDRQIHGQIERYQGRKKLRCLIFIPFIGSLHTSFKPHSFLSKKIHRVFFILDHFHTLDYLCCKIINTNIDIDYLLKGFF